MRESPLLTRQEEHMHKGCPLRASGSYELPQKGYHQPRTWNAS